MRKEGYLYIDHRASPGFTEAQALSMGLDPKQVGEGKLMEAGTATCSHCNAIVILNPQRVRERGHCQKCDAYICDTPSCHADCTPYLAKLDQLETAAYRNQQNNLSLFTLKEYKNG
jgi:hypothetical protein